MKIKIHFFFFLVAFIHLNGQVPLYLTPPPNVNLTWGMNYLYGSSIKMGAGGYQVSSSAKLDARAKYEINVEPGLQVTNLSSAGEAHFQIDPNFVGIASFHPNGFTNIPQYDRFELGIELPVSIQQQIDNFLQSGTNGPNKLNPYDPYQVKIECHFSKDQSMYVRYGFYYSDFTSDTITNTWTQQPTPYTFRVRVAPPEIGDYNVAVHLYINNVFVSLTNGQFNVVAGTNHGHLSVDLNGTQKLKHDDGTMFFGIGGNITWASNCAPWPYTDMTCGPFPAQPAGHNAHRYFINDLGRHGGNFVRIRLDPWSVPIEGKDWSITNNPPPLINYLNNYHHNQKSMWEMDKTLALCEAKDIKIMLTLLTGMFQAPTQNTNLGMKWNDSPYSALLNDTVVTTGVPKFFTQTNAIENFQKKLFYILARWGYSTSIGIWSLINEVEMDVVIKETESDTLKFNLIKADVANWSCYMRDYLRAFYPMHPVTSGITKKHSNLLDYQCMDVFQQHIYHKYNQNGLYRPNNDNIHEEATKYFAFGKPLVFGELGYAGCNPENPPTTSKMVDFYNDRDMHNRLWATTMGGCLTAGLNFFNWAEEFVNSRKNNFPALKAFASQVDFSKVMIPSNPGSHLLATSGTGTHANEKIFNYSMETAAGDYLVGWSVIGSSFWANDDPNTFNGEYYTLQSCIPTAAIDYGVGITNTEAFVLIPSLSHANTTYNVELFKTYGAGGSLGIFNFQSDGNADIKFRKIFNNHDNNAVNGSTGPDIAYIVKLPETGGRSESTVQSDSLLATTDSIICFNSSKTTTDTDNIHLWNMGNGILLDVVNPCFTYTQSGTYQVEHAVTPRDPSKGGTIQTTQFVTVRDKFKDNESVYPVPASNYIFVNFTESNWNNPKTFMINSLGQEFPVNMGSDNQIDLSSFVNGFYTLRLVDKNHEKSFKIIVKH